MKYGAYGLVEVLGEANGVIVTDMMLKTSEVYYETQDTKCGGHVLIFVGGDISSVTAAIERVQQNPPCQVFASAVIANPSEEMERIVAEFKARRAKK